MNITKERYGGRIVGLLDALGMKYHRHLTPEEFYQLPEVERQRYSMYGVEQENCHGVIADLRRLSFNTNEASSPLEQIREYKIGLREGMMMVKHNEDLMKLTLPINYWDKDIR